MTASSAHGELLFRPLDGVDRVPYEAAFLIKDLCTTRITFVTGEPKAGKSLFVAGMGRALLEGHNEFLGQRVLKRLESIVYCYSDDGAEEELAERFAGTAAMAGITVLPVNGRAPSFWPTLVESVIERRPGLFVLDTVLGSLASGEDIASSLTAQLVVERVRPIAEAGIPVVLVTHTPKGNAEGLSVASSVIGGRALAGGARGIIALRKSNRDGLSVQTQINRAKQDLNMHVQVERLTPDSEVPVWSVREKRDRPKRKRSSETLDWRRDLALRVATEQPAVTSMRKLGEHYDGYMGKSANTIRADLKPLVAHDGNEWVLQPVLTNCSDDIAA